MERHNGHSLPELMFVLAIVAGTLGYGVPSFRGFLQDNGRTREVNALVHGIHLARSEAIKRNGAVSLCPSADGEACGPAGTPWQAGWIVFVNRDRDQPAVRDGGEELLRVNAPWTAGQVSANRATLTFRAFGQMGVTSTFVFCDRRGGQAARAVIVSQTGRPRASDRDASGRRLTCI